MIKTFEKFNELDPYGEENWGEEFNLDYILKELKKRFFEIEKIHKDSFDRLIGINFLYRGHEFLISYSYPFNTHYIMKLEEEYDKNFKIYNMDDIFKYIRSKIINESYNELDPYGEEEWDNKGKLSNVLEKYLELINTIDIIKNIDILYLHNVLKPRYIIKFEINFLDFLIYLAPNKEESYRTSEYYPQWNVDYTYLIFERDDGKIILKWKDNSSIYMVWLTSASDKLKQPTEKEILNGIYSTVYGKPLREGVKWYKGGKLEDDDNEWKEEEEPEKLTHAYNWDTDYFIENVFNRVKIKGEFTVEDFIDKFNELPKEFRKAEKINGMHQAYEPLIQLFPRYSYHYNLISKLLHDMVKKGLLRVRYFQGFGRSSAMFLNI